MKASKLTIEIIDDETAEMLARKSGAQRLSILFGMHRFAKTLIEHRVKKENPTFEPLERQREVARRLLHGSI
jgi:hypothetical protein